MGAEALFGEGEAVDQTIGCGLIRRVPAGDEVIARLAPKPPLQLRGPPGRGPERVDGHIESLDRAQQEVEGAGARRLAQIRPDGGELAGIEDAFEADAEPGLSQITPPSAEAYRCGAGTSLGDGKLSNEWPAATAPSWTPSASSKRPATWSAAA